jgi:hypothetical protein
VIAKPDRYSPILIYYSTYSTTTLNHNSGREGGFIPALRCLGVRFQEMRQNTQMRIAQRVGGCGLKIRLWFTAPDERSGIRINEPQSIDHLH